MSLNQKINMLKYWYTPYFEVPYYIGLPIQASNHHLMIAALRQKETDSHFTIFYVSLPIYIQEPTWHQKSIMLGRLYFLNQQNKLLMPQVMGSKSQV